MDVSPPALVRVSVGSAMMNRNEHNNCIQAADFHALQHGPPKIEELLTHLAEALVVATRRAMTAGDISPGLPSGEELVENKDTAAKSGSTTTTTTTTVAPASPDDTIVVRRAYLDELCLHLSTGASCGGPQTITSSGLLPPLPLPVRINGGNQKMQALLMRLSGSSYWRSALLIPLLRRWWGEGRYSFFGNMLLQSLLNALGDELLRTDPEKKGCVELDQRQGVRAHGVPPVTPRNGHSAQVMREMEEVVQATGSFHGICLCIECIIRCNTRLLLQQLGRISVGSTSNGGAHSLLGDALSEVERVVGTVARSVWEEVFAFLSRCTPNVEAAFCESTWTFLMTLLTAYAGSIAAMEVSDLSAASRESVMQLQAQRLFVEKLQQDLQCHLTVRLLTDRVSSGELHMAVYNATCRLPFFWRAAMETELAPELLSQALLSRQDVRAWAWKEAATAWGHALRLVQSFVQVQEAMEDLPVDAACTAAAAAADSVASSIQRCQRRSLEDYVERLASARLHGFFAGTKRPREAKRCVEGEVAWSAYANDFFLRVYHPSCFTILSFVKQDALVSLLRQLHAVTVNGEREAVRLSLTAMITRTTTTTTTTAAAMTMTAPATLLTDDKTTADLQRYLLQWHSQCVHGRVMRALRENAPLLMCLLFAVFTLLERLGKTNFNVHSTLREMLLPILANLCGGGDKTENQNEADVVDDDSGGNDGEDDGDVEDYYERQQCIMMLLASGCLALPWDLRGLRLRLLMHKIIALDVQDCFSAEEALTRVDHLFVLHTADGQQTLEDVATTLYSDLACDPVMQLLAADVDTTETTASSSPRVVRESTCDLLLRDTPVQFPAPCGTLLLISIVRTLSFRMLQLRAEWEQQVRLAGESSGEYLGRQATFCTTRDVTIFRVLVQLAHRMVFGFQVQPVGLLRLWISHLNHLFTHVVPPLTGDDEMLLQAPHAKKCRQQEQMCHDEDNKTGVKHSGRLLPHRVFRRSSGESSQGELRVAVGELLADLALMPLVESDTAKYCPAALLHRPGTAKWLLQQTQKSQDLLMLQRVLPIMVLEEVCFSLKISLEDLGKRGSATSGTRHAGRMVEQSFLGALGVVAFCQRLELFILPGSVTDERVVVLLQALWSVVEENSVEATT